MICTLAADAPVVGGLGVQRRAENRVQRALLDVRPLLVFGVPICQAAGGENCRKRF